MAYVTVPRDLDRVRNKVIFNLTLRQVVCIGLAAAIGAPFYFLTKGVLGPSNAATGMVILMLPVFFFALYEKDGLPLEKVLMNIVTVKFLRPANRSYGKTGIKSYSRKDKPEQSRIDTKKAPDIETNAANDATGAIWAESITEDNKADNLPSEKLVLSFAETDIGGEEKPISEQYILKEVSHVLNRNFEEDIFEPSNGQEDVTETDHRISEPDYLSEEWLSDDGYEDDKVSGETSNNIEEKPVLSEQDSEVVIQSNEMIVHVKYEPLTAHEAYLDSLLEGLV